MAHELGLAVVAEGVETGGQHRMLEGFGCDYAQGYLFSRPVAAAAFGELWQGQLGAGQRAKCLRKKWRSGRDSNPRPPGVTGRYSNQLNYRST